MDFETLGVATHATAVDVVSVLRCMRRCAIYFSKTFLI